MVYLVSDFNDYSALLSARMNSNFRVKVDGYLVGYSGLCLKIGFRRANHLIQKSLNSRKQKIVFKAVSPAECVIMYSK